MRMGAAPTRIVKRDVGCWHVSDDEEGGKASRLCPGNSDVDLFGYGESIINLNAEIPDCALDLVIIPPACD